MIVGRESRWNMIDRFENAPLVELAAEVRWGTGGVVGQAPQGFLGQPQGAGAVMFAANQYEDFFMRIGSKAGALGYDLSQRVVPPGFPQLPFQAVYRFRNKAQGLGTTLYQVGAGVFSVNITPPYHSWKLFRPVVDKGIELLLEARNQDEQGLPFVRTSLRYINSFDDSFVRGRTFSVFVQDVLGFKMCFPESLRNEVISGGEIKPFLQLHVPLNIRQQMTIILTEGLIAGQKTIIMDMTVVNDAKMAPAKEDVLASFDGARGAIHNVFEGMTTALYDVMKPITDGGV
jgi:uncharacterized protein (TIGR04255 family)